MPGPYAWSNPPLWLDLLMSKAVIKDATVIHIVEAAMNRPGHILYCKIRHWQTITIRMCTPSTETPYGMSWIPGGGIQAETIFCQKSLRFESERVRINRFVVQHCPWHRNFSSNFSWSLYEASSHHAFARTIEPLGILYPRYSSAAWVMWGNAIELSVNDGVKRRHRKSTNTMALYLSNGHSLSQLH